MSVYTKTGDAGETGLPGGVRIPKDDPIPEFCGTVDELNSMLGLVRSGQLPEDVDALLAEIQNQLFNLGAEVARRGTLSPGSPSIAAEHIETFEQAIDRFEKEMPPLAHFILPGGTPAAAGLHLARTFCRRAERRLVGVARMADWPVSPVLVPYLNRLSDLLFVLARLVNARAGQPDVLWRKGPQTR